jgi:hypothetical protein
MTMSSGEQRGAGAMTDARPLPSTSIRLAAQARERREEIFLSHAIFCLKF